MAWSAWKKGLHKGKRRSADEHPASPAPPVSFPISRAHAARCLSEATGTDLDLQCLRRWEGRLVHPLPGGVYDRQAYRAALFVAEYRVAKAGTLQSLHEFSLHSCFGRDRDLLDRLTAGRRRRPRRQRAAR